MLYYSCQISCLRMVVAKIEEFRNNDLIKQPPYQEATKKLFDIFDAVEQSLNKK